MSDANQYANAHNSSHLEMSPMNVNEAATTDLCTNISDASLVQREETVNYVNEAATTNQYTTIPDASLVQRYETLNHVNGAATTNLYTTISDASLGQREETFKRTHYRRLCCFAVIILLLLGLIVLAIIGVIHLSEPSKDQDHPTTTQGSTTTTTPPPSSQFINCTDETAFLGKSVTLTCNMTVAFDYINVTKATRNLADVTSVGNVINRNLNTGEHVIFGQSSLQITYESVECDDGGLFTLFIQKTGGSAESQAVTLNIWAKPKSVSMTLHADFVINTDRAGAEHVCEGFVGYPGGQLEVTMTKQGDPNVYSVPLADYDGSRAGGNTMTTENCNNKARLEFGLKLGTEWRNGTITCRAKNSDVLEDGDVEQNDTATLYLIPADLCNGENEQTFKANPYSCNKYVQCANDLSYGRGCGEECYTGLSVPPLCGDCQTYPCTIIPTTTTTTTQSTTTPPPDVYIAFNAYNRREEVGSSGIVIGCNVRNAPGWTNMMVTRITTGSTAITSVFSMDRGNSSSKPLSPRASYAITEDDSSVSVTITLSTLSCEDRGVYTCTATGQTSPLTTNMTFEIFRNPGTPKLTLNPDQIQDLMFHRGGLEHQCLAEVGFPPGNLTVVYKMKGKSTFEPFLSDRIIQHPTKTSMTSCGTTKYFKFGLNFTSADDSGEVKCVVTNQELGVTTESDVGTLELIPREYCNTTSAPQFLHHPTNCNKYVQCQNKYPYGSQCIDQNDCATIGPSIVICGVCDGVICPWNITTTTQGPTTTTTPPPSSQFINCTDETAFKGKSVTLTCNMTVAFDYINVTKATRNLADVTSVGNVINRNLNTGEHVVFGQSSLQITYESVECDDGGLFTIFIQKTGGSTESHAVTLNIWSKPKSVSMTLHADFVINTDRLGAEHVCEGFVGYPGGQLEVTMTKQGDPNVYSVPLADYDGSRPGGNTMTTENCNNKARLEFGLKLGTEWRNGTITCRAKNSDVLEDGDVEQNDTATLYLIPADFCSGETDNTFKANPYSCNKLVQCSNDLSYGIGCGEECYTGLSVAPLCGDCQTYPCTIIPTTTTTTTQATTTPPPDVFVTCSGANSFIGSSATVTCSVNKDTYSYINVTFTPSKTQTSSHVVDIHPTNGVANDNSGASRSVTVFNAGKNITIALTSLTCSDEGIFHFDLFAITGDSSTTASVSVRDTPKTNPTLTLATRVATGLPLYPNIKCSGETGYPSGIIDLQIKYDGSSSFVNVTEFTKVESSTDGDCAVTKVASFSGTPTMAVNGSYIRCATSYPDAVNTLFSAEERLLVIDGNLCNGKSDGAFLYHPYSCGKVIQCANNVLYVVNCGSAAPCIRINETSATGYCDMTCAHCPSYHIIIPNTPSSG